MKSWSGNLGSWILPSLHHVQRTVRFMVHVSVLARELELMSVYRSPQSPPSNGVVAPECSHQDYHNRESR